MLKINVKKIPDEGMELAGDFEAARLWDDKELRLQGPVTLRVRVTKSLNRVTVMGDARTGVSLDCSRCMESYGYPVKLDLSFVFEPSARVREREGQLKAEDFEVGSYSGEEIDIGEELRQLILLKLPMKPVCAESCAGLCPQCGENLKKGRCSCIKKPCDSPLRSLRGLAGFEGGKGGTS